MDTNVDRLVKYASFGDTLSSALNDESFYSIPVNERGNYVAGLIEGFSKINNLNEDDKDYIGKLAEEQLTDFRISNNIPRFVPTQEQAAELFDRFPDTSTDERVEDVERKVDAWKASSLAKASALRPAEREDIETYLNRSSNNFIREEAARLNDTGWFMDKGYRAVEELAKPFHQLLDPDGSDRFWAKSAPENPSYDQDFTSLIAGGIGQVIPQIAISIGLTAAGSPEAIPAVFTALYGAEYMQNGYREEFARSGDEGKAWDNAVSQIPAALLETVGDTLLVRGFTKTARQFGKEFASASTMEAKKAILLEALPTMGKAAKEGFIAEAFVGGMAAEWASGAGSYLATGDENYLRSTKDIIKGGLAEGIVGGLTAGLLHGVTNDSTRKAFAQDVSTLTGLKVKQEEIYAALKNGDFQKVIDITNKDIITDPAQQDATLDVVDKARAAINGKPITEEEKAATPKASSLVIPSTTRVKIRQDIENIDKELSDPSVTEERSNELNKRKQYLTDVNEKINNGTYEELNEVKGTVDTTSVYRNHEAIGKNDKGLTTQEITLDNGERFSYTTDDIPVFLQSNTFKQTLNGIVARFGQENVTVDLAATSGNAVIKWTEDGKKKHSQGFPYTRTPRKGFTPLTLNENGTLKIHNPINEIKYAGNARNIEVITDDTVNNIITVKNKKGETITLDGERANTLRASIPNYKPEEVAKEKAEDTKPKEKVEPVIDNSAQEKLTFERGNVPIVADGERRFLHKETNKMGVVVKDNGTLLFKPDDNSTPIELGGAESQITLNDAGLTRELDVRTPTEVDTNDIVDILEHEQIQSEKQSKPTTTVDKKAATKRFNDFINEFKSKFNSNSAQSITQAFNLQKNLLSRLFDLGIEVSVIDSSESIANSHAYHSEGKIYFVADRVNEAYPEGAPVALFELGLIHESAHAGTYLLEKQDPALYISAKENFLQNKELNDLMVAEYPGYETLSEDNKFYEGVRAIIEGRLKGRTTGLAKGGKFAEFLNKLLNYIRNTLFTSRDKIVFQFVSNVEDVLGVTPSVEFANNNITVNGIPSNIVSDFATIVYTKPNSEGISELISSYSKENLRLLAGMMRLNQSGTKQDLIDRIVSYKPVSENPFSDNSIMESRSQTFNNNITEVDREYLSAVMRGDNRVDDLAAALKAAEASNRQAIVDSWMKRNPKAAAELQRMVDAAIPPVKTGMTRMWRAEPSKGDAAVPGWMVGTEELAGIKDASGRWFYKTREEAVRHVQILDGSGLSFVDIPTDEVDGFNARDNKFAGGYGKDGNEFFLSRAYADARRSADPVTYDESGNVIPLSQRFDSTNNNIQNSQPISQPLDAGGGFVFLMAEPTLDNKIGKHTIPRNGIVSEELFQKIGTGTSEIIPAHELAFYKELVPNAFTKEGVDLFALYDGLKEANNSISVFTYGQDIDRNETEYTRASDKLNELTHTWFDNLPEKIKHQVRMVQNNPGTNVNINNTIDEEYREKAKEYIELDDIVTRGFTPENSNKLKATSYYNQISPFDTKKFPVLRVDVVLPEFKGAKRRDELTKKYKGNSKNLSREEMDEYMDLNAIYSKGPLWTQDNLHENLPNTLGWAMVQIVPHPVTGEKVMFVGEAQSRWGQEQQKMQKALKQGGDSRYASDRDYSAQLKQIDHPLLSIHQNLILKSVIKEAQKQGITQIAISDAETAMMTEGHDTNNNNPVATTQRTPLDRYDVVITPDLKKRRSVLGQIKEERAKSDGKEGGIDYGDAKITFKDGTVRSEKETKEYAGKFGLGWHDISSINIGRFIRGKTIIEPSQAKGMRLAYDVTLPSIAKKLTRDNGTAMDFGVHKNTQLSTTANQGSPVFKNADGTPKTNATALVYTLNNVQRTANLTQPLDKRFDSTNNNIQNSQPINLGDKFSFRLANVIRNAEDTLLGLKIANDGTLPTQNLIAKVSKSGITEFEVDSITNLINSLEDNGRVNISELSASIDNEPTLVINTLDFADRGRDSNAYDVLYHQAETLGYSEDAIDEFTKAVTNSAVSYTNDVFDSLPERDKQLFRDIAEADKNRLSDENKSATGRFSVDPYDQETLDGAEIEPGHRLIWSGDLSLNIPLPSEESKSLNKINRSLDGNDYIIKESFPIEEKEGKIEEFQNKYPEPRYFVTTSESSIYDENRTVTVFVRDTVATVKPKPKFESQHYSGNVAKNQVAFVRGGIHEYQKGNKLPNGSIATETTRIFEIWEVQSDWDSFVKKQQSLIKEGTFLGSKDLINKGDPLLKYWESLALKAAINHAKKEGASNIIISDAETAMMTEKHDDVDSFLYNGGVDEIISSLNKFGYYAEYNKSTKNITVNDHNSNSSSSISPDKNGKYTFNNKYIEAFDKDDITRISQEKGMRAAYDQRIPNGLSKLSNSKGKKVTVGEHNKGPSKVFKNPDGTPKNTNTGLMFPVNNNIELQFSQPITNEENTNEGESKPNENIIDEVVDSEYEHTDTVLGTPISPFRKTQIERLNKLRSVKIEALLSVEDKALFKSIKAIKALAALNDDVLAEYVTLYEDFISTRSNNIDAGISRPASSELINKLSSLTEKAKQAWFEEQKDTFPELAQKDFQKDFQGKMDYVNDFISKLSGMEETTGTDKVSKNKEAFLAKIDNLRAVVNENYDQMKEDLFSRMDLDFKESDNPHIQKGIELMRARMNDSKEWYGEFLNHLLNVDVIDMSAKNVRNTYYALMSVAYDGYVMNTDGFVSSSINDLLADSEGVVPLNTFTSTAAARVVPNLMSTSTKARSIVSNKGYIALQKIASNFRESLKQSHMMHELVLVPYQKESIDNAQKKSGKRYSDSDLQRIGIYAISRRIRIGFDVKSEIERNISQIKDSILVLFRSGDKKLRRASEWYNKYIDTLFDGVLKSETPLETLESNAVNAGIDDGMKGYVNDIVNFFDAFKPIAKFTKEFIYNREFIDEHNYVPTMILNLDESKGPLQYNTDDVTLNMTPEDTSERNVNTNGMSGTFDRSARLKENQALVFNINHLFSNRGRLNFLDAFSAVRRKEISTLLNAKTQKGQEMRDFLGDEFGGQFRYHTFIDFVKTQWKAEIESVQYIHQYQSVINGALSRWGGFALSSVYQGVMQLTSNIAPFMMANIGNPQKISAMFKAYDYMNRHRAGLLTPQQALIYEKVLFDVAHRHQDQVLDTSVNLGITQDGLWQAFKSSAIANGISKVDKIIDKVKFFQFRAADFLSGAPVMLAEYLDAEQKRLGAEMTFEDLVYDPGSYAIALDETERFIGIGNATRRGEWMTSRDAPITILRHMLTGFAGHRVNNATNFYVEMRKIANENISTEEKLKSASYIAGIISQSVIFSAGKVAIIYFLMSATKGILDGND
jgi:hypothetical protein